MTHARGRLSSSILVICIPLLLLAIVGLFSGSLDLGEEESAVLMVVWIVGLVWVWVVRPLRARRSGHG